MKLITILTCSSLLIAGAALAATDSSSSTMPAPATAAPAAATHMDKDDCAKDATSKGLHGKERHSFIKTCRAAKK
jgi:psiF repeat